MQSDPERGSATSRAANSCAVILGDCTSQDVCKFRLVLGQDCYSDRAKGIGTALGDVARPTPSTAECAAEMRVPDGSAPAVKRPFFMAATA